MTIFSYNNHALSSFLFFQLDVAKNPSISKDSSVSSSIKGVMGVDEASKILNCSKNPSREELISVSRSLMIKGHSFCDDFL